LHGSGISKFLIQITYFSSTDYTLGLFGVADIGKLGMKNKPNLGKSYQQEAQILRHGHSNKCLAIFVVKDWLNKGDAARH
jgi:hypothetical protein